ncbi:MAG TPA: EAL domain-containing protein, partial [Motiliproteus sp.]
LVREIGVAKRHNSGTAILFIDLDHFKKINDALGHPVGDRLLQETAQRISTILRSEDTCARVGGDEFVVLIPSLQGSSAQMTRKSHHVAEQIRRQLGLPYEMDGRQLRMSVSIGIAIHPDHDDDAGILVRHADTAMYKAKLAGRNCIRFFNPEMQDEVSERLDVELALRSALENNELSLAFQPQIDRQYGLVGAEVLLRWHSASLGMVSPAQFIPIAEDTGLIISIGDWVMRTAMNRARELSEAAHSGGGCRIAINVSQVQFKQRDFVETVVRALADTGVNPCLIELEITESMLVDHVDAAINKIQHLRELGIRFSIDDFGTGYSSLSYLKLLPLDKLKIDQSFVRGVDQDEQDAAIVEAIIAMARHLKLDIIAEGVETEAERDFLAAHGCDKYQGYLYYRPMPWSEFRVLCTGDEPSTANLSSTAESVEP